MFRVNNKHAGIISMMSFWCLYCLLETIITTFYGFPIVDVEQVNTGCWDCYKEAISATNESQGAEYNMTNILRVSHILRL